MLHASALRTTAEIDTDLIPVSAAEREDVFFFGTLMHLQVLEAVLDRPVAADEVETARLSGYRRVQSLNATYPIIVEHEDSSVDGIVLSKPSFRDILRINHFEDEEYVAGKAWVEIDGEQRHAWVFQPFDLGEETDLDWHLDDWSKSYMPGFLDMVQEWMEDAPN